MKGSLNVFYLSVSAAAIFCLSACGGQGANADNEFLVKDQKAFVDAVEKAEPGDTIKLANGTWEDFEILFVGQGEKDNPISLMAETPGEVFLTGQSNLRLGGEYLEVSGLIFKDGYTPTKEVISFRQNKENLAHNS